jgi:hypothetical protein
VQSGSAGAVLTGVLDGVLGGAVGEAWGVVLLEAGGSAAVGPASEQPVSRTPTAIPGKHQRTFRDIVCISGFSHVRGTAGNFPATCVTGALIVRERSPGLRLPATSPG